MQSAYAEVIPLLRLPRSLSTFTYRIEPQHRDSVVAGRYVRVPFRHAVINGVVVSITHRSRQKDMQAIREVLSEAPVDSPRLRLLQWMSSTYLTSLGTVGTALLPVFPKRSVQVTPHRLSPGFTPVVPSSAVSMVRAMVDRTCTGSRPSVAEFTTPDHVFLFYFLLAERVQTKQETALLIVPERARAEWITSLLTKRLGSSVRCLHAGFSATEYAGIWRAVAQGGVRFLVVTRRGLLAPFPRLSTVVVDMEEDTAHKQWDQTPRFAVPDVAAELARLTKARYIATCLTPRLETYDRAKRGSIRRVRSTVPHRVAPTRLIDLRRDRPRRTTPHVSDALQTSLSDCLARKRSAVILLNRRGYASRLVCADCGTVPPCPTCRMPYHFDGRSLTCRFCGRITDIPAVCPNCGGARLQPRGIGIEALAGQLRTFLPAEKIRWADAEHPQDTRTLGARILLTTEWIFHQPPIRTGVAAIVDADALLSMPDYRARERALMTMRAFFAWARPETEGLLQTVTPDEPVYRALVGGRYEPVYDEELRDRRTFGYPPATTVILAIPPKSPMDRPAADIRTVRERIDQIIRDNGTMDVLDGIRHPRYPRAHHALLLRIPRRRYGPVLQSQLTQVIPTSWIVDVDPLSW